MTEQPADILRKAVERQATVADALKEEAARKQRIAEGESIFPTSPTAVKDASNGAATQG